MELNALKLILHADIVVKFVMTLLIAASIASWAIIFLKVRLLRRSRRNSEQFVDQFWSQRNMENVVRKADEMESCPTAYVFKSGYSELMKSRDSARGSKGSGSAEEVMSIIENVDRALRRSVTAQLTTLERRVPFLATTGSSSPFIGLFGTVWGIMNSFMAIGSSQSATLATVGPGIAEALIATAVGLFAAIPAVIGYNYCVSQIRVLHREMENFSNDFLNVIKRQLHMS